jgi:hypothetical protein
MIVALEGTYQPSSRPGLRQELEPAATAWNSVIDVTQISDADPLMLAELLSLSQSRRRCGLPPLTLVASSPSEAVWKVFDVLGMAMNCRFTNL